MNEIGYSAFILVSYENNDEHFYTMAWGGRWVAFVGEW